MDPIVIGVVMIIVGTFIIFLANKYNDRNNKKDK